MKIDGSVHERVLVGGQEQYVHNTWPAISDDGQIIALPGQDGANEPLVVLRRAGAAWTIVRQAATSPGATHHFRPSFSRDGARILFECSDDVDDTRGHGICEVQGDGTAPRRIWPPTPSPTPALVDFFSVSEAPSGDLVFEANDGAERVFRWVRNSGALSDAAERHAEQ